FRDKEFRSAVKSAVKLLNETGSYEAVIYLTEEKVKRQEVAWRVEHAVVAAMDAVYRFEQMKSEPTEVRRPLRKLTLSVPQRSDLTAGEAASARGLAIAHGMDLAKDLGNLPGNVCTPRYFAERAQDLGKEFPEIKVTVLERPQIEALGMGSFLSVTNGSDEPPRFIVFEYRGSPKKQKPVVLVGKGITFDTGGISIKPAANMHHMTSDMGGAAAVIATVVLAAKQQLPIDVIATVPMAENMPSSTAQRPGDVLTQYGGITVEVLNTDAEGRLILADAIVRACEDKPDYLIETSTLTGAQTVALGARTPGVMGSDEFRDRVAEISQTVGENGWPMPLPEELKDDLKSTVADLANVSGSRYAGMLVAGTYLREFVADGVQWAHIDIAAPAYNTGGPWGYTGKGGTGVPTRTMFAVLEDIAANG
ncbi:MAG TPA: leucyl aminopeptidase, partial [Mycobacterium sp.]|nr:leucyl aminopeptidase [Mycobacterium sp.]